MKTISTDDAQDIVESTPIAVQEVSQHRWYTKQLIVYASTEGLRGFYYLKPATEIQEDQDRFISDPVEVFPVVAREVVTTVYEVER